MAANMRKTNANSKLDNLQPPSRVLELRDGLLSGWTYVAALDWLKVECGVSTGMDALSRFWRRHCAPILQEQKKWASMESALLGKMMDETEAFEAGLITESVEFAYKFLKDPNGDPEAKRKWLETILKKKAGEREDVKVSLLVKKAAELDELKA
jgi:hypothetical protein